MDLDPDRTRLGPAVTPPQADPDQTVLLAKKAVMDWDQTRLSEPSPEDPDKTQLGGLGQALGNDKASLPHPNANRQPGSPLKPVVAQPPPQTVLIDRHICLMHQATQTALPITAGPRVICLGTQVDESHKDIDLWALTQNPTLSRRHALLLVNASQDVALMDAGSKNGTFVNRTRLTPMVPLGLVPGDELSFGSGVRAIFIYQ